MTELERQVLELVEDYGLLQVMTAIGDDLRARAEPAAATIIDRATISLASALPNSGAGILASSRGWTSTFLR